MIKDRIADMLFQQVLLRPDEYDVIATPNLNGDYISDALAAQVGGLGMAPGANIGDTCAVFEATHGTAPKYTGLDKVNPGSLILSGAMMLDYMGWKEAGTAVRDARSGGHQGPPGDLRSGPADRGRSGSEMLRVCRGYRRTDEIGRWHAEPDEADGNAQAAAAWHG